MKQMFLLIFNYCTIISFTARCSLLSSISVDNIHSYTSMSLLIILLHVVSILLSALAQWFYSYVCSEKLVKPYQWFCWCRKIFMSTNWNSLWYSIYFNTHCTNTWLHCLSSLCFSSWGQVCINQAQKLITKHPRYSS